MWRLCSETEEKSKELKQVFTETLQDMMSADKAVIALEADLGGASGFLDIKKSHPDQFLDVGIAEANMIGVAAGLSMLGYIPYVHTFCPFASRRVEDQLFLSGAYAKNTINIYASDPGVCAATNGGTHTSFEDLAFMRALPEALVFDPADDVQLEWLVRTLAPLKGIHYIRASRKAADRIYERGSTFEIGKGNIIKEGSDVLLISMGEVLGDALRAANELEQDGISTEVVDMFTVKPLDSALILQETKGKQLIVTFENHSVINGLGSAVSDVLSEAGAGIPLRKIGVNDQFGQVGSVSYLKETYGLTRQCVRRMIFEGVDGVRRREGRGELRAGQCACDL